MRVLFAAGQTAGHVYPALTIATQLHADDPGGALFFASTANGLERGLIGDAGYEPQIVRAAPIRGGSISRWFRGAAVIPAALRDAARLIRRLQPDVVIGTGGYLSGPSLVAASRLKVPTLLIELNVLPGLANRCVAPCVDAAALAWSATAGKLRAKTAVTGAPVRPEMFHVPRPSGAGPMHLLVLGGSLGAPSLNRAFAAALPALVDACGPLTVAHQTGPDANPVRREYERRGRSARVSPFFHDMPGEYRRADLVITAAGGMTCAELCAAARPSILIPLAASNRHQRANAAALAQGGAAVVIDERALTPAALTAAIVPLLMDAPRRAAMAASAAALARPRAVDAVIDLVHRVARGFRASRMIEV